MILRRAPAGEIASRAAAAWFRFNQGITVTGSGVAAWDDQSGNSRSLLQGTDAKRPALQSDGSLLFNGSSHDIKTSAFTLNQPTTIYLTMRQVTWDGPSAKVFTDGNTNSTGNIFQTNVTPDIALFAGSVAAENTNLALNTYGVVSAIFNGASSSLQANATAATTGDAGAANMGGLTLGGIADETVQFSNIQVKEVAAFPVAHDAGTRFRVNRAMATITGVGNS